MLVGARNVQICTAVMKWGYRLIEDLIDGLSYYLVSKNLSSPGELVGKSLASIAKHEDLSRDYRVVAHIDESLCLRDGRCYIACRDGGHEAIKMSEDRLPVVDEDRCLGCGLCTTVCPVRGCITLREKR